ncbi:MAG: lipoprotein [Flavobacteriales bacterium]
MIRRFAPFVTAVLLLAACGQTGPEVKGGGKNTGPGKELVNETHCYLQVTHGAPVVSDTGLAPGPVDSLYIRMDVLGELVNGVYNWLPGEKDAMTGTFTGTLENGVVTALYTYRAEGETAKQEVLFKLADNGLLVGNGDLVKDQGVWLFKDKSRAEYGEAVPEVDCK